MLWEIEKVIRRIKKFLYFCFGILISISISFFILKTNDQILKLKILEDDYILNMIGVLMGLSIAIVTFLFTAIEKVKSTLLEYQITKNQAKEIDLTINNLFSAIMKDTIVIFIFFVVLLYIILTRGIDIPILKIPYFLNISKEEFVILVKLTLMNLSLFSLFDIIISLFGIMNGFHVLSNRKMN
jgi:hypothetical protein